MPRMRFVHSRRSLRVLGARGRGSLLVLSLLLASGGARAQPTASTSGTPAQRLFDEGRALDVRGLHDEACSKFVESEALEPAVGTLLNLATCADRRGATATAWQRYREAATLAARNGDAEREASARRSAFEIEKRLSRLVLTPPTGGVPAAAVIRRDADAVPRSELATPAPVDPGQHVIAITAPGFKPWSTRVDVGRGPVVVAVALPELQPEGASRTSDDSSAPSISAGATGSPLERERSAGFETAFAYVVGAVGVAALGVGAYYALRARAVWNDVTARCPDARCPDAATAASLAPRQEEASRDGTAATIAIASGVAAIGTGALIYVLSLRASSSSSSSSSSSPSAATRATLPRWTIAGDVGPRGAAVLGTVRFE